MLWYQFGPYEAYYNTGNYAQVLAYVKANLVSTSYVEETWYWRGMVEAATGKNPDAISDFRQVLSFNPNFLPATKTLNAVQSGTFSAPAVAQAK